MDIKVDLGINDLKKDLKNEAKKYLPKDKEGRVSKAKICGYGAIGIIVIGFLIGVGHNLADLCFGK